MANFGNFLQDIAQKIPGNKFAQTRVGDVLTGGVARAVNRNKWEIPSVHGDQTSIDDLAAVGTGNSSRYRTAARTAGLGFGSWGMGELSGTPNAGLPEAFSFGDPGQILGGAGNIFGGGVGWGLGNRASGDIQNAGNRGVSIGAPLENQQRQQYQQQLTGMMNDPSNFLN